MNVPENDQPIRVLLTVPDLESTTSPYRELMAIARYLPRPEFSLTVCSLRENGYQETEPLLRALDVVCLQGRFRPTGYNPVRIRDWLHDQRRIAQYGPFDIQHSLDFTPSPFEAIMARYMARRYIFSQRNMNSGGSVAMLRAKIRLAQNIIAISESTRQLVEQNGASPSRCVTIPLGMELTEQRRPSALPSKRDNRYILTVGHVVRRKRIEDAILSLPPLLADMPELNLKIVGRVIDETYYHELLQIIHQLRLEKRISFLGERRDVLDLMENAEALLLCSDAEAFGWVILEAMSVGIPVIASAVDGPKEVITHGKTGFLAEVGNVEGYVQAIRALLNDEGLRESIACEAKCLLKQKYDARQMVARIADFYRAVHSQSQ